ncbi:MAG: hypothetical protein KFH87_12320 [Bacteroidetes bacterium]|nr:hypothetical protein [Bacteroidota bacterium]
MQLLAGSTDAPTGRRTVLPGNVGSRDDVMYRSILYSRTARECLRRLWRVPAREKPSELHGKWHFASITGDNEAGAAKHDIRMT